MKQKIRYVKTSDGIAIAWARSGQGRTLVRASNWLTHLEYDWQSPVWRHWTRFLATNFDYVRYDERGCGLTDWKVTGLSVDRWVADLDAVVEASKVEKPMLLFGVSQGAAVAIAYAVKYPERVSGLVLYGGYARGARRRDPDFAIAYDAMQELVRIGWRDPNPVFRQLFTSRFIPDGTEEQIAWFNDLCQRTTTPEAAYLLLKARSDVDICELLPKVRRDIGELQDLTMANPIYKLRHEDVGYISLAGALALGLTGPSVRAAGYPLDLRKSALDGQQGQRGEQYAIEPAVAHRRDRPDEGRGQSKTTHIQL